MSTFLIAQSAQRDKVIALEDAMRTLPQVRIDLQHNIHGGMYARTGFVPAGASFTGAVHKLDHLNIISGDITVLEDNGPVRYTGYHVMPTNAGSKRVGFAHADTFWTTVLATDLTDIAAIEDAVVEDSATLQTRQTELTFTGA